MYSRQPAWPAPPTDQPETPRLSPARGRPSGDLEDSSQTSEASFRHQDFLLQEENPVLSKLGPQPYSEPLSPRSAGSNGPTTRSPFASLSASTLTNGLGPTTPDNPLVDLPRVHFEDDDSESAPAASNVRKFASIDYRARAPSLRLANKRIYVNLMVCGMSGLGKTTGIQNMLASYFPHEELKHDGSATSFKAFENAPESLLTVTPAVDVPDTRTEVVYTIQDTPGWGDQIDITDNIDSIINHIRLRKFKEMQQWRQVLHEEGEVEYKHMLDACLYFIPPHRFNDIDRLFISKLSKEVTVIPIIAKADSMTIKEVSEFKRLILDRLRSKSGLNDNNAAIYDFGDLAPSIHEHGILGPVPPFAIVGSHEYSDQHERGLWPVRKYAWGTCETWNEDHSDFSWLKRLLFESGAPGLRTRRHNFYVRYVATERTGAHAAAAKRAFGGAEKASMAASMNASSIKGSRRAVANHLVKEAQVARDEAEKAMNEAVEEYALLQSRSDVISVAEAEAACRLAKDAEAHAGKQQDIAERSEIQTRGLAPSNSMLSKFSGRGSFK